MFLRLSYFDLALYLIQFILAAFAFFYVALGWKRSTLKLLILATIVLGFLIPNLLILLTTGLMYLEMSSGGFRRGSTPVLDWFIRTTYLLRLILTSLSIASLLAYVIFREKESRDATPETNLLTGESLAPLLSWNTAPDSQTRISISRKREWAFLVDTLPAIVFNLIGYLLFSITNRYAPNSAEEVLWPLFGFAAVVLFFYIPLKDSIGGQSFGKRITKCRVVQMSDGAPIGIGRSLARNLLLLIPFFAIIELVVANSRHDRRRLGDLLAKTTVVTGKPDFINGIENKVKKAEEAIQETRAPHPLDD